MSQRSYSTVPRVGVGGILFSPDLRQVLLIQRGSEPARGLWSIPGGMLQLGESLQSACLREIQEEVGLQLKVQLHNLAEVVERLINDGDGELEYHYIILDYWGIAEGDPLHGSDAADAAWVALEELGQHQLTPGLAEVIKRALGKAKQALALR